MKILGYLVTLTWISYAVALLFGFEPRISMIAVSFLLSALATFKIAQEYK